MKSSWLDLGPGARRAMAAAYVALQLGLIVSGPLRADHVFGFQMFNASSQIRIELLRRVRLNNGAQRVIPVRSGRYSARDAQGRVHEFRWQDRVRDPVLSTLDRSVHAKDGVDAQLFHLQRALDDTMRHAAPNDAETLALIARVRASDNGRPRPELELEGARP